MPLNPVESLAVDRPGPEAPTLQFQWGDLTHAEASKSLRLFTEQVMPAFATA